ncbi:MAG: hypothetical protein JSS81_18120 [Acidobacteria bacterium]|nr:hypothetical protein [Acidobacteriota bacterium]
MKNKLFSVATLIVTLFAVVSSVFSQAKPTTQITEREKKEARIVAKTFAKQFLKEKDISALLRTFFVENFLEHFEKDEKGFPLASFKPEIVSKISKEDRLRFYIVFINSYYLNSLYISKKTTSELENMNLKDYFPPEVSKIIESNPQIFESISPRDKDEYLVENPDDLKKTLPALEEFVKLMQQYFKKNPIEQNKNYQKNISILNKRNSTFKPWLSICDNSCYGYPTGTRLIMVNIPFLQLLLVKEMNYLKILSATPYF